MSSDLLPESRVLPLHSTLRSKISNRLPTTDVHFFKATTPHLDADLLTLYSPSSDETRTAIRSSVEVLEKYVLNNFLMLRKVSPRNTTAPAELAATKNQPASPINSGLNEKRLYKAITKGLSKIVPLHSSSS